MRMPALLALLSLASPLGAVELTRGRYDGTITSPFTPPGGGRTTACVSAQQARTPRLLIPAPPPGCSNADEQLGDGRLAWTVTCGEKNRGTGSLVWTDVSYGIQATLAGSTTSSSFTYAGKPCPPPPTSHAEPAPPRRTVPAVSAQTAAVPPQPIRAGEYTGSIWISGTPSLSFQVCISAAQAANPLLLVPNPSDPSCKRTLTSTATSASWTDRCSTGTLSGQLDWSQGLSSAIDQDVPGIGHLSSGWATQFSSATCSSP